MSGLRVLLGGLLALLLLTPPLALPAAAQSVVVLPPADYSQVEAAGAARARTVTLQTLLAERLAAKGLVVPHQEIVFPFLTDSGIIELLDYENDVRPQQNTVHLENELGKDWSDMMKKELSGLIASEQKQTTPGIADQDNHLPRPDTVALDEEGILTIGREFAADYILRSRMMAYDLGGEFGWLPHRRNILPFFGTVDQQQAYAVASAAAYDTLDTMFVGSGMASDQPAHRKGVQLQLWLQDATSGEVLWSGKTDTPIGVFIKGTYAKDFATASAFAVSALIDEMWGAVAVDSDGDGVFDHRDQCPDTPPGTGVDVNGCPADNDGDGIPDYADECPATPINAAVDSRGCPTDRDGDGVPDYLDDCPDTLAGVAVDTLGCPMDSDNDGVADARDKCPDTAPGTAVDERGCPKPLQERVSMELQVQFDFDKAEIRPEYHDHLAKVADFLKTYPNTTAVIEGHTDNVGTAEYNLKLSQKRAENVRQYLIDHFGIAPSRLVAKGFGESRPVAANDSPVGQSRNRRSVAVISTIITPSQ